MNLDNIMQSEISQTWKDKYCKIPLMGDTVNRQVHGGRKQKGGGQGLRGRGNEELVFHGNRLQVLQNAELWRG